MPWCELDDLIECLNLNVRNLEIWEFLILACVLEIDWRVLFPMMWSHVLCYSFWIWVCLEVWIVPLFLHEIKVLSEAQSCLMREEHLFVCSWGIYFIRFCHCSLFEGLCSVCSLVTNLGMYHVNGTRSKIKIYWYFSVDTKLSCLVTGSLNYIEGKDCVMWIVWIHF